MDSLALIDTRIRNRLERVNKKRVATDKEEVRLDLDTPLRGYLQLREEFIYRFRVGMRFMPLLTIEVTYRDNVYYFEAHEGDQRGRDTDIWKVLKHPPGRNEKRNESFWLTDELDLPLEAIEKYMDEVLLA